MIRLAKVAVIAALAAFALIVVYNNVFDYNSNYQFVQPCIEYGYDVS